MTAEGALMEPIAERSNASGPADVRLVSVIVPVVERADDLMLLYHAFAARARAARVRSTSSCSSSTADSSPRRSWPP